MNKYEVEYKAIEDASQISFKVIYEVEANDPDEAYEAAEDKLWATFLLAEYSFELSEVREHNG